MLLVFCLFFFPLIVLGPLRRAGIRLILPLLSLVMKLAGWSSSVVWMEEIFLAVSILPHSFLLINSLLWYWVPRPSFWRVLAGPALVTAHIYILSAKIRAPRDDYLMDSLLLPSFVSLTPLTSSIANCLFYFWPLDSNSNSYVSTDNGDPSLAGSILLGSSG